MLIHTKYSTLSDEEFLSRVETIKHSSPIILELATRLEKMSLPFGSGDCINNKGECPVCEAELTINYNEGNAMFELELQNG